MRPYNKTNITSKFNLIVHDFHFFKVFNRNEILFCHHKTMGIQGGIFLVGGRGEMGRETLDSLKIIKVKVALMRRQQQHPPSSRT